MPPSPSPSPAQTLSTNISKLSIEKTLLQNPPTPPNMNLSPSPSPSPSPSHHPYTNCTIANPTTFSTWLDEIGPENTNAITHLHLHPSQHLGRIISLPTLGDTLGDSLGDQHTLAELHAWIALLQRLANVATGIRCISVFFAADVSSGMDSHLYRRGVGECLAFIWAIGKFDALESVDLGGFFPVQWPFYLRSVWGDRTRIFNSVPAPDDLLCEWRKGTERLDPRDFECR